MDYDFVVTTAATMSCINTSTHPHPSSSTTTVHSSTQKAPPKNTPIYVDPLTCFFARRFRPSSSVHHALCSVSLIDATDSYPVEIEGGTQMYNSFVPRFPDAAQTSR